MSLQELTMLAEQGAVARNAEVVSGAFHILEICALGQGNKECRYLCKNYLGHYECAKNTNLKSIIDRHVQEWHDECCSYYFESKPSLGDNCPGRDKI